METLENVRHEIEKCNRCGYCQETCPVYGATGVESSVARGRIALVRDVLEGRLDLSPEMENALFECLLCRACLPVCAPGVETDRIVAAARAEWRRRYGSPVPWQSARSLLLDRDALVTAARASFLPSRLGLSRFARSSGLMRLFPPALRAADELVPDPPRSFLVDRVADMALSPSDAPAARVGYFVSCGMNLVQPDAAVDTIASMVALGCDVALLDNGCCGLPAYVAGEADTAEACAVKNLTAIEARGDLDLIVTECASCSSHLRRLPELVPPELAERAGRAVERVLDYSELLLRLEWPEALRAQPRRVTFHDPCHLSRHQSLSTAPREVLRRLPGVELVEMRDADRCCGGAGSYGIAHAAISESILQRKMADAAATGADTLVTACPACMVQLAHGARAGGLPLQTAHLSSLVAFSLCGVRS